MSEETSVIPASRLARWLMLLALLAGGIVLYFRDGLHLPAFGATAPPSSDSDTTR